MASIKKVIGTNGLPGPYDIYANTTTIHGNLTVIGNTTALETTNSTLTDTIIVLNDGEAGAGVTAGYAGITVSRGLLSNVSLRWNEAYTKWQITNDGTTYGNLLTSAGGATAGGSTTQVQYNSGGSLAGSGNFTFNNGNLSFYGTTIGNGNVTTSGTNQDLVLYGNGAGTVNIPDVVKLGYQSSAPSNVASTTQLFANTVGAGGTGLYVVNSGTGDELITKTKATVLALIFG